MPTLEQLPGSIGQLPLTYPDFTRRGLVTLPDGFARVSDVEDEAFLAAIETAPDDPAPRAVYADWLEERGDPRAELVRIEGELWREPIDSIRVKNLCVRRRELARAGDPGWRRRVSRPSLAELRRRLAIVDGLDPERRVQGAAEHQYRLNAPLSLAEVEEIEARIGCRIPAQYRRFLIELADGGAGPGRGLLPIRRDAAEHPAALDHVAEPFPPPGDRRPGVCPPGALIISRSADPREVGNILVFTGPEAGQVCHLGRTFSPSAKDIEFIDWYGEWLDQALQTLAYAVPDDERVFARDPREIYHLDLTGRGLTALPDEMRRMTGLYFLELGQNPIEELPDWIGELAQLQILGLAQTKLRRLPEGLGQLHALNSLLCDDTPTLEELPASIGQLSRLWKLSLSGCGLATLPDSFPELRITHLDLSGNRLVRIPASMGWMGLKNLDLASNRLTELPDELAELEELRFLSLAGNPIRTLPDCVARLPGLQRLNLDHMPGLDLADACRKLQHARMLGSLSLSFGGYTSLPDEIGLLTQLDSLYFVDNPLSTLPDSLAKLTGLRRIGFNPESPLGARLRELLPHLPEAPA